MTLHLGKRLRFGPKLIERQKAICRRRSLDGGKVPWVKKCFADGNNVDTMLNNFNVYSYLAVLSNCYGEKVLRARNAELARCAWRFMFG